jgi:hypothetical protein
VVFTASGIGDYEITVSVSDSGAGSYNVNPAKFTLHVLASSDTTPPVVTVPADMTIEATSASGAVVSYIATATDTVDGSIIPVCVPTSGSTFPLGTTTVSCTATDANGNTGSASFHVIVQDTTPPAISCGSADGDWHGTDVAIICTASDSGSGLSNLADASFSLTTSVVYGTETSDAATDSRNICDIVGNCAIAGPISGNKVDKKAPSIVIGTPTGQYVLNQVIVADYNCADDGSGEATCVGTIASGSPIDTNTVGSKTFKVTATDNVGNIAEKTVTYTVQYSQVSGRKILQPLQQVSDPKELTKAYKLGSTLPVKFQLSDYNGAFVGTAKAVIAVYKTSSATDINDPLVVIDSGLSNDDGNIFRYDPVAQQYVYNLNTKNLAVGTFRMDVTLDDGTRIVTFFELRK